MKPTKIGLGLAALGRPDYINIRTTQNIDKSVASFRSNALKVLDESYELGIRDFDVAPSYGLGEKFLNDWNTTRQHTDVNLSTKFGYTYVANWELGYSGKHEIKEHSISKLNSQWEVSKNLLPNLKNYQIHSATLDSGVLNNRDVLHRLYELKQHHQLKIGLSSSGTEQLAIIKEAQNVVFDTAELFDSYQVTFNIFEQSCFEILRQLLANGKTIIIKEALANGRVFRNNKFPKYSKAYEYLEKLSIKYNVGSDAIALRFIIDILNPSLLLSGGANMRQIKDNLKAFNFQLEKKDIIKLKSCAVPIKDYWEERSHLEWN